MSKPLALILTAAGIAAFSTTHACAQEHGAAGAPNDAQIAMIAVVANTVDVDAGKLAAEKSKSKAVKDFAQTMIRDHTAVNGKATALAKKLGVTPEESATSKSLKADGDAQLAKLKGMSGAEFDKAYVDNEVTYHQTVIDAVDKTLIPNTKNAELKALLESVRPVLGHHLTHAKELQKSLSK